MEGGSITPPIRNQAMRLAVYLDSIQQTPNVSGNNYREYVVNLSRQLEPISAKSTAATSRKFASRHVARSCCGSTRAEFDTAEDILELYAHQLNIMLDINM